MGSGPDIAVPRQEAARQPARAGAAPGVPVRVIREVVVIRERGAGGPISVGAVLSQMAMPRLAPQLIHHEFQSAAHAPGAFTAWAVGAIASLRKATWPKRLLASGVDVGLYWVLPGLLVSLAIAAACYHTTIEPGTFGVVTRNGALRAEIERNGRPMLIPFLDRLQIYEAKTVEVRERTLRPAARDGLHVASLDYSVAYRVTPEVMPWLLTTYGVTEPVADAREPLRTVVEREAATAIATVIGTYSSADLFSKRDEVSHLIETTVRARLGSYARDGHAGAPLFEAEPKVTVWALEPDSDVASGLQALARLAAVAGPEERPSQLAADLPVPSHPRR